VAIDRIFQAMAEEDQQLNVQVSTRGGVGVGAFTIVALSTRLAQVSELVLASLPKSPGCGPQAPSPMSRMPGDWPARELQGCP